ncbi:MAG: alpha/beta hydrolase [Chloroflexi bacterium]|nr:alpha/beta hydrolase [Chloroflexota bacterium]
MANKRARLSPLRMILLFVALVLIVVSWWQVGQAAAGLVVRHVDQDGLPLRFVIAEGVQNAPGVLIGHGFSGSQQLMLAYGYVLAHAGYGVMLLDFAGHGANATPFVQGEPVLTQNVALATAVLQAQPEVDASRLALIGHSMGSRAVLEAGVDQGDLYRATIAISPGDVAVDENWPRNLLLMAGSLEAPFLRNAQAVLARAGGPNPDFSQDKARALVVVDGAEHMSILFRPLSHNAALDWLNNVFGVQRASAYQDVRIIWYGLHLAAWLVALLALSPLLPSSKTLRGADRRRPFHWLGLVLGAAAGTAVVWLLDQVIGMAYLGGLAVGGALGVWFFVVGLVWLLTGFRPFKPVPRRLAWGLAIFASLWLAFGLLSQWVWLPWFLIPARLLRWLPLTVTFVPWLLAAGIAMQGAKGWSRLGWWAWQSVVLVPALIGLVFLVPGLAFLALVVVTIPLVVGVMTIVGAAIDDAWAYSLGGALFFSWLILTVFPLAG